MWSPGPGEIVVIVVVALLIFGPKKLPEMGKAIGNAITEFKKGISGKEEEAKAEIPAAAPEPAKVEEPKPEESTPSEPAG